MGHRHRRLDAHGKAPGCSRIGLSMATTCGSSPVLFLFADRPLASVCGYGLTHRFVQLPIPRRHPRGAVTAAALVRTIATTSPDDVRTPVAAPCSVTRARLGVHQTLNDNFRAPQAPAVGRPPPQPAQVALAEFGAVFVPSPPRRVDLTQAPARAGAPWCRCRRRCAPGEPPLSPFRASGGDLQSGAFLPGCRPGRLLLSPSIDPPQQQVLPACRTRYGTASCLDAAHFRRSWKAARPWATYDRWAQRTVNPELAKRMLLMATGPSL